MGSLDRAFRNIWRKRMRTGIVLLLLSISLATMVSTFTSVKSSQDHTQSMIDDMNQTLTEVKEQAQNDLLLITISGNMRPMSTNTSGMITSEDLTEVATLDEVTDVVPIVTKSYGSFQDFFRNMTPTSGDGGGWPGGQPPDDGERPAWGNGERPGMGEFRQGFNPNAMMDYILEGVPLTAADIGNIIPANIVRGQDLGGVGSALISEELTDFFDADVGDTITIDGEQILVAGVYNSTSQNKYVYTALETAQDILNVTTSQYHQLRVYAKNESVIDGLVTLLQEYFTDYRVMSNRDMNARRVESMETQTEERIVDLNADLSEVESSGFTVIGISMGMAGIIVLFIMLYTVRERTREIGTLKALGFTSGNVMSQFILEGILLSITGGAIGVALALLGGPIITNILMPDSAGGGGVSIPILAIGFATMLVLGIIGSLYPSWLASRRDPVEAMRHE